MTCPKINYYEFYDDTINYKIKLVTVDAKN